jgi:hypothetical protein
VVVTIHSLASVNFANMCTLVVFGGKIQLRLNVVKMHQMPKMSNGIGIICKHDVRPKGLHDLFGTELAMTI